MLLRQMLYRTEVRLLPVIAGFWVRLQKVPNYEDLIRILCEKMLDANLLRQMLSGPDGTDLSAGLRHLTECGGTEPVEAFETVYGSMRVAGIEKILREKYWKAPLSITEKLFYRGLIFRENRMVGSTPRECYILPEDLKALAEKLIPGSQAADTVKRDLFIVRPASPAETRTVLPICQDLPDLFTLAAALKRDGKPFRLPGIDCTESYNRFTDMLLTATGMFSNGAADPERIRGFLVQNRTAARLDLLRAWRNTSDYDELSEYTEALTIIESPDFDRKNPRIRLLDYLCALQPDTWWSLSGFIAAVKKAAPQFLRGSFSGSHGRITDRDGNDLSGIGSWFQLEGAYIEYLIFGPLYWLGITQPGYADSAQTERSAFRISKEGMFFLQEAAEAETSDAILAKPNLEQAVPVITADGIITCSCRVPRYFRYMAARFSEIERIKGDIITYRITPNSLKEAERGGISRDALLSLLRRFSKAPLPPSLERMLAASERNTLPATIYSATILTVPNPEVLDALLETSRLEKWIIQQVNQNSLMIDPKGIDEIRRFLMEREIFVDIQR